MASWYMQIGGYYFDLVAYLFGLAAFTRLSVREETRVGVTEGLLLACAVLSKQSIGIFCAASFGLVVLAFFGWRALFTRRFLCAFIGLHLAALAYLVAIGGVADFLLYAVNLQSDFAAREKKLWRLTTDFLRPWGLDIITAVRERRLGQVSFYPIVLTIYLSYAVTFVAAKKGLVSRHLMAGYAFLLLSTVWSAATPGRLYTQVTFGFSGIAAITLTLSFHLLQRVRWSRFATSFLVTATVSFVGIALLQVMYNSFDGRRRQPNPLNATQLWPLTFNPQQANAIEAARFVAATGKSYALFGGTFLNAIPLALGRAPLDPVLFYEDISMIPRDEVLRHKWEAMMIREFECRCPEFLLTGFIPEDLPHDHFTLTSMASFALFKPYVQERYPTVVTPGVLVTVRARHGAAPPCQPSRDLPPLSESDRSSEQVSNGEQE
jgi:hypothetical protein